jgi:glycine hydroxymethyltransferase
VVVRFRFTEKGVRMAHAGDPVVDKRGRVIGWVTAAGGQRGFLRPGLPGPLHIQPGTPIAIFQSAPQKADKAPVCCRWATGWRYLPPPPC